MILAASGINNSVLVVVLASAVVYGTPLLYAGLGELLAERSGVLNLGVEGMMLVGAVMALSGAIAGIGGASQDGDIRHTLDPRGLTAAGYGYAGIVIAALARYNPFAVVLVAFLLGGLQNAGYTLQGVDFPSGLVGVMQGLILFCALGGELLTRYRIRVGRAGAAETVPA